MENNKKTKWVLGVDQFPEHKEQYYWDLKNKYATKRITTEIAYEYHKKAEELNTAERYALMKEFSREYEITELEALNILNGYHIADYIKKYEDYSNGIFYNITGRSSRD